MVFISREKPKNRKLLYFVSVFSFISFFVLSLISYGGNYWVVISSSAIVVSIVLFQFIFYRRDYITSFKLENGRVEIQWFRYWRFQEIVIAQPEISLSVAPSGLKNSYCLYIDINDKRLIKQLEGKELYRDKMKKITSYFKGKIEY